MTSNYYLCLTPQDILIEGRDWNQTNTSYSGDAIYEWNLDGLSERQLFILVHQMLMYSTIAKVTASVENRQRHTDATIYKIIVTGLTSQLHGWWDNFLDNGRRNAIFKARNSTEGVDNLGRALPTNTEDVVCTLMLTIIEHFGGRFTNQYENTRTLLNGLRCRTLGEFRWYKDTFLRRVMDLIESKYTHWKAKFIDGLPPLFTERVKKELRGSGSYGEISYENLTYGQLIAACTRKGLALYNELKLATKIKLDKLKERFQLGDFYEQFESENNVKLPNSSDSDHANICDDCNGNNSICDETFYKLQSQFEDLDLNVQTLTADSVLDMATDPPWQMDRGKGIGRGRYSSFGRRSAPSSSQPQASYASSSNSSMIQRENMSLLNSKIPQIGESSSQSIHLKDIPEDHPLYGQLQSYLIAKQENTFVNIAKENVDSKPYEQLDNRELIVLVKKLRNSKTK
ncbi:uncharacterized protein LOC124888925 [Capsicum annuum]|uniref:uncharacterized protein LOC124888925 n=1 Tax=Capsicum annuum TaxID=4072 RepID=UPI001FB0C2F7|nr:uncharacterized protein LOC124888925 [Capsicum annuum]